jgi:hypothetical protein
LRPVEGTQNSTERGRENSVTTDDASRYRKLAAETRAEAELVVLKEAQRELLEIADGYEDLAERAEHTGVITGPKPPAP